MLSGIKVLLGFYLCLGVSFSSSYADDLPIAGYYMPYPPPPIRPLNGHFICAGVTDIRLDVLIHHPPDTQLFSRGFTAQRGVYNASGVATTGTNSVGITRGGSNGFMSFVSTSPTQTGRTMQLLPQNVHRATRHTGGAAVLK